MVEFSRRKFLGTSVLTALGLSVFPSDTLEALAQVASKKKDISYLWHPDIGAVLEYMEEVERVLGPGVARDLHVVKGAKNFGLIYDRDGESTSTEKVAEKHNRLLLDAGLEGAESITDEGYGYLYNVSYGLGKNLDQLKKNFKKVYEILGNGVGKDLVIEKTPSGNLALVYQRRGNLDSTREVAQKHSGLLRRAAIDASFIQERNNEIVFSESIFLDSEIGEREANLERKVSRSARVENINVLTNNHVQKLRRGGRIASDEKTAWSAYDFSSGNKILSINEDIPMQCASMVKPLVALAFFHRADEGGLIYGPKSKREMERMIRSSKNDATNWTMGVVGGPKEVQRILKEHYGEILRDISIVEYIPQGGRTYRNKASAHDYSRFLYAMWKGELPFSRELRRLMALPNRDRMYNETSLPRGTLVYDKTGSTARLCGDMGIICALGKDGERYPYTLIGIIEKNKRTNNYRRWIRSRGNAIREVSEIVYAEMKKKYDLR